MGWGTTKIAIKMALFVEKFVIQSWLVLGQMAPYLLLGFLMAGILSVFVSPTWIERRLGKRGMGPVVTASLLGVPLPLCSCGVIPIAASIRRHGASRAATTSFLLSTPQTGIDSIAITYALLGPVFAIFRPIVALVTGIWGGFLVQIFGGTEDPDSGKRTEMPSTDGCRIDEDRAGPVLNALRYGFITLPQDIGWALGVGIFIAGLMATILPQGQWNAYVGGGILSILILMAAGIPFYVCATASVPIAAGLLHAGASPGAVLAFLISGPATNTATIATVWKVLGRKTAVLYLITVAASAIVFGLALDWIIPAVHGALPELAEHAHGIESLGWFEQGAALLLLAILFFACGLKTCPWSSKKEKGRADAAHADPAASERAADRRAVDRRAADQRLELRVAGMTCSHCAHTIRRTLMDCHGVIGVDVDIASGRVIVEGNSMDLGKLASVVEDLGYKVQTRPQDAT